MINLASLTAFYNNPKLANPVSGQKSRSGQLPINGKDVSVWLKGLGSLFLRPFNGFNGFSLSFISKKFDKFSRDYLKLVDAKRRELVMQELSYSRLCILKTDFTKSSQADRKFVAHMVKVGKLIEELYMQQKGSLQYQKKIPKGDAQSLALFHRNRGPWCETPKASKSPFCGALLSFPPRVSDAYPEDMPQSAKMCKILSSAPNGKDLMDPFKVVRRIRGKLVALPLTAVYGERMTKVARELRLAAQSLDSSESKLKAYLLAAAKGFENNKWEAADEAWVAMNSQNSKWFVRVAPDETYFDVCQEKAGFELAFAKIDPKPLFWQAKLNPLREEMERNLTKLIGKPYQTRKVSFNFPDFVEIVLNSGDARHSRGGVLGQTLPNWGKVSNEGRTRTIVMTNIFRDRASLKLVREKTSQLLDSESMKYLSNDKEPNLLATVLHEATHNFGPYTEYRINGKTLTAIFGGRNALTLEELKAQTGALWYVDLLKKKGLISEQRAREIYTDCIKWCFGHISQGMFTASGTPRTYGQLSAVQIGHLVQKGAITWVGGKFHINFDRMPNAVEGLMQRVGRIMAKGDRAAAEVLLKEFISGPMAALVHANEIEKRLRKFPNQTLDYKVVY